MPQPTPLTGRHIVLCAYQQVHGRRVVQDDVQARHVLLHADGRPRVIDFEGSWRPTEAQMGGFVMVRAAEWRGVREMLQL